MKHKHTQAKDKAEILRLIEKSPLRIKYMLELLDIPSSTYYRWKRRYEEKGEAGLKDKKSYLRPWNRLTHKEEVMILTMAMKHTDSSPRELACLITDEEGFSVSESTVYRLLKRHGLLLSYIEEVQIAEKEYYQKTKRIHEMWQTDLTYIFIHGWGWYYIGGVIDDFSRYLIVYDVTDSLDGYSVTDLIQKAIEITGMENVPVKRKVRLLSDNGSGYISNVFNTFLKDRKIDHIYSSVRHPQTCGKIERLHRSAKEKLKLVLIRSPEELEKMVAEFHHWYNEIHYHEAIGNLRPIDVYEGRAEVILRKREQLKRRTLQERKKYNLILT